ncbi:MAG TPA: hypothetical protein VK528_01600 [Flavobacterium sp.]|nr:hypothetical protein [Flavobacterium sp.]
MKYPLLIFIFLLLCCNKPKDNAPIKAPVSVAKTIATKDSLFSATTDTIILKDINSDKINDTAFVYTPPTLAVLDAKGNVEFGVGCPDNHCYNKITFSCKLPEIAFEESVWGALENAGDLNGDGISELLFMPGWFTSSLTKLYLYSLKNGKWEIITSVEYRRNDAPLTPNLIQKGKKYFLRGVDLSDGDDRPVEVQIKFK